MNRKIAITAITLVAVTMGIAAISPAVFAQEPPRDPACNALNGVVLSLESLGLNRQIPPQALEEIDEAILHIEGAQRVVCLS